MFGRIVTKFLESKFIKGKLTYAGIAIVLAPLVSHFIGLDISSDNVNQALEFFGLVVTIVGRLRAAHQAAMPTQ